MLKLSKTNLAENLTNLSQHSRVQFSGLQSQVHHLCVFLHNHKTISKSTYLILTKLQMELNKWWLKRVLLSSI